MLSPIFNLLVVFLKQIETDDHTALVSKPRNKGGNGDLASAGFNIINSIIGSGIIGKCTSLLCVQPCLCTQDYPVLINVLSSYFLLLLLKIFFFYFYSLFRWKSNFVSWDQVWLW